MNSFDEMKADNCVLLGRVLHEDRNLLSIQLKENGEVIRASIAGGLIHHSASRTDLPTVGDYVECTYDPKQGEGRVERLLERQTVLKRKVAGEHAGEQILGANIDTCFYLSSLNMDLNLRRMERYLIMIKDGGIEPVIVLTKSDLISEAEKQLILERVNAVAIGHKVICTSALDSDSFNDVRGYLTPHSTIAFLGSSGVGKSTMTNVLLGKEECIVQVIRGDDDKGKHTTTARSLYPLPNGCLIMDTPGIREVQLWEGDVGLEDTFGDIALLMQQCGFRNCQHDTEPNCAINNAIDSEELCADRYRSYLKLGREQRYMAMKSSAKNQSEQKKNWKRRSIDARRGRLKSWKP